MVVKITATLYHADWCGHCKTFLPEWQQFTKNLQGGMIKHNNATFHSEQYEDKEITRKNISATINGQPIRGFPTIKISINENGKIKEFDYQGKRKATELATFLKVVADRALTN
jgi:thiol-disulfide isomerase/thioredoxin